MPSIEDILSDKRIVVVTNERKHLRFGQYAFVERLKHLYGTSLVVEFKHVQEAEDFLMKTNEVFRACVFCFDEQQVAAVAKWWESDFLPAATNKVVAFYNSHTMENFEQYELNHDLILVLEIAFDTLDEVDRKIRNILGFPPYSALDPETIFDNEADKVLAEEVLV